MSVASSGHMKTNSMIRVFVTVLATAVVVSDGYAQRTTKNNYTGNWESAGSWVGGSPAATSNIGAAHLDLTINGFITRNGGLSFAGTNDGEDFRINDTLVVRGDISFANKAANLILGPNAVLIVFGNFSATNKIVVENGGIFVVTGNMSFSASNQDDYSNPGGGELYVGGSVSGNNDAEEGEDNWDDLGDDYPIIWDYVLCGGEAGCSLPINLSYFRATVADDIVKIGWATIMEKNFQKFVVQRSSGGIEFHDIGEVSGKGFDILNIETVYSFRDVHPLTGHNYYRLKAVDLDDSYEYFGVIVVKVNAPKIVTVYPNPSSGKNISFAPNFNPQESDRIIVIDQMGSEMVNLPVTAGQNAVSFEEQLKSGVYFLRYVSEDFEKITRVIVRN